MRSATRHIALNLQTTGFEPGADGIVEVSAAEMIGNRFTGTVFHRFVNPRRTMSFKARMANGVSSDFLSRQPDFSVVAPRLAAFVEEAPLVVHNADFVHDFLHQELSVCGVRPPARDAYLDTSELARPLKNGERTDLDGVLMRCGVEPVGRQGFEGIGLVKARRLAEAWPVVAGLVGADVLPASLFRREVYLDTKTTGFSPRQGHRIVEVGVKEAIGGIPTGRIFHSYCNPQRDIPAPAAAAHGLTEGFLADKPLFRDIAPRLRAFIGDAVVVAHNLPFDRRFLDAEFEAAGQRPLPEGGIDPCAIAKKAKIPAKLDDLCDRFGISRDARAAGHGAMIDTNLLFAVTQHMRKEGIMTGPQSVSGLVVAGTGHRPEKLGGYGEDVHKRLQALALRWLYEVRPTRVISGMALGWDTALAEVALHLRIPVTAAIPCDGQDSRWPDESRQRYARALKLIRATGGEVVTINPGPYAGWKMQARNRWMVDNANVVLALHDGSSGGTQNCVLYARGTGTELVNLWGVYSRNEPLPLPESLRVPTQAETAVEADAIPF